MSKSALECLKTRRLRSQAEKIVARVGIPRIKVVSLNKVAKPSPDIIYPFGL